MEPAKRIVVNTLAQHVRSVINICLSLYSTRIVLQALGESDFGVYSLVAGVVAMLAFLTNAMVITTQRQLSFWHGKGDLSGVRQMFSNSLLLHIIIGAAIALGLVCIEPLLFNGFLVLDAGRLEAAVKVYYLVIASLLITFLTAPYRALFIARENIVYISVVDVLDGLIKLSAALWLLQCPFDRLIAYAWIVTGIMAFNLVALVGWAQTHFSESLLLPRKADINRDSLKELTSFAGWTIYSVGCILGRTQGVAVILNRFFGTVVNASFGIAQQVFGSVQFIAQSVLNAMSPQLIKAEGAGDRQRMLLLAERSSKYAFFLLALVIVPLVFEIPEVLRLWLGSVPPHAVLLCRIILVASLVDQVTIGLGTANQAIGKIRTYSIVVNTIKVLTLPAMWLLLILGYSLATAMSTYFIFEGICALVRIPFLQHTAGLCVSQYVRHVFLPIIPPVLCMAAVCLMVVLCLEFPFRFLLTGFLSCCVGGLTIWMFGVDASERQFLRQLLSGIMSKFHVKG